MISIPINDVNEITYTLKKLFKEKISLRKEKNTKSIFINQHCLASS